MFARLDVMIALSSLKGYYSAGRVVHIAVIGAGIRGLSSAAILNSLYGMQTEMCSIDTPLNAVDGPMA